MHVFVTKSKLCNVFLVAYLLVCTYVSGSHFRGGYITWSPENNVPPTDGSFPTVLFTYRVGWRRSFSSIHFCDQQTIDNGISSPGEGRLRCDNGCNTLSDNFDYTCTDFSVAEDWTSGLGSSSFTPSSSNFDAYYGGGAWINFVNGGGSSWILRTSVDLTPRPDNNLINSSPITATLPIVRVLLNCPSTIPIPAADVEGDIVRCRYATSFGNECASICQTLPGATLDQDACTIQWTPTVQGLYGVAIQIEDYLDASSTTRLSSVPLQYMIDVRSSSGPCTDRPSFSSSVSSGGSCFGVSPGQTFTSRIIATVSDSSQSITSIDTISPAGLTTTEVQQIPGSTTEYFIDVEYTPSAASQAIELVCFVAMTNTGLTTEQRCFTFATTVPAPVPLAASVDSNNLLTISVDQMIKRPDMSKSIRIVFASNQRLIYNFDASSSALVTFPSIGSTISIQLPRPLPAGASLLVQLDGGAVETTTTCVAVNDPVNLPLMTKTERTKKKYCF